MDVLHYCLLACVFALAMFCQKLSAERQAVERELHQLKFGRRIMGEEQQP
jgi:hypothetical protein